MLDVVCCVLNVECCVLNENWVLNGHVGRSDRNDRGSCESRGVKRYEKAGARVRGAVSKVEPCALNIYPTDLTDLHRCDSLRMRKICAIRRADGASTHSSRQRSKSRNP